MHSNPVETAYRTLVNQAETLRQTELRTKPPRTVTHDVSFFVSPDLLCDERTRCGVEALFNEMERQRALCLISYDATGKRSSPLSGKVSLIKTSNAEGRSPGETDVEPECLVLKFGNRRITLATVERVRIGRVSKGCEHPHVHLAIKGYTPGNRLIQVNGHCDESQAEVSQNRETEDGGEANPMARL